MEDMSNLIIDILSDTHNRHESFKCKGGDILLHSGDCTGRGSMQEAIKFLDWFGKQPYSHRIMIAGNHDWIFEDQPQLMKDEAMQRGIILLNDSGAIVKDMENEYLIRIWGSPVQPWFHNWAFNRARTEKEATARHPWIKPHWDMIPKNTEILLSHGPPYMILDEVSNVVGDSYNPEQHVGCEELAKRILETNVKLHVFGHIHEGRGCKYIGPTTYVNGSSLDRMYCPADDKPIRINREVCQDGSIVYLY